MPRPHRITPLFIALLLALLGPAARQAAAARVGPRPLLSLLGDGYGVVAAEVVESRRVTAEKEYPAFYDTVFKVHEVTAPPIGADAKGGAAGNAFPLRPGDSLQLRLSVGYACQVEWDAPKVLASGKRFYLIVKKTGESTYQHATGASALRGVEKIDAAESKYYARCRELAAVPQDRRMKALLDVVKDPGEPARLRSDALSGIAEELRAPGKPQRDTAAGAIKVLLGVWKDPASRLPADLLNHLDYVLRSETGFEHSPDRRDGWLVHLLALTPDRLKDDNNLDNLATSIFGQLATEWPRETGDRLAAELSNEAWPEMFRRSIAYGLLTACREAERVEPAWEAALQNHFVNLMKRGQPFSIRVACADLEWAASPARQGSREPRRRHPPGAEVRAAMAEGLTRLVEAARQPGADIEFATAAGSLREAIRSIDAAARAAEAEPPAKK